MSYSYTISNEARNNLPEALVEYLLLLAETELQGETHIFELQPGTFGKQLVQEVYHYTPKGKESHRVFGSGAQSNVILVKEMSKGSFSITLADEIVAA